MVSNSFYPILQPYLLEQFPQHCHLTGIPLNHPLLQYRFPPTNVAILICDVTHRHCGYGPLIANMIHYVMIPLVWITYIPPTIKRYCKYYSAMSRVSF